MFNEVNKISRFLNFDLPRCPYCGMKLLYTESFVIKNRSSYKCLNCNNISEVFLPSVLFKTLQIIQIISLVIFIAAVFKGSGFCLLGLVFIVLIFSGFYCYLPFMIKLKLSKDNEEVINQYGSVKKTTGKSSEEEIFSN